MLSACEDIMDRHLCVVPEFVLWMSDMVLEVCFV